MELNKIICGNNIEVLQTFPDNIVDNILCSPPYDKIRAYKNKIHQNNFNGYSFDFEGLVPELYRILKPGGVIVWVVGDSVINNSESGNSFRQALYFKDNGFLLWDTMIYEKNGASYPASDKSTRYSQVFEYCFILVKPQRIFSRLRQTSFFMKKEDSAWLASAIDGEGCIRINPQRKSAVGCYRASITVGNTNRDFVEHCKHITNLGRVWTNKQNNFFEWNVGSNKAGRILAEIYPFLIIKKEQAKVFLKFQEILKDVKNTGRYSSLTNEEIIIRKELFLKIKALNQREIFDSGLPELNLDVILKGSPNVVNLLKDKPNKWAGAKNFGKNTKRTVDGELKEQNKFVVQQFGYRDNIWRYNNGYGYSAENDIAYSHPAIFPLQLAIDHIKTWSNENDIILDPFVGSGTVPVACKLLNRNYIGVDISQTYCDLSLKRLSLLETNELYLKKESSDKMEKYF